MKISVEQSYLEYQEGTSNKFYHIVVIANKESNRATIIKRYGPIGKFGNVSVKNNQYSGDAIADLNKTMREKERKGYKVESPPTSFPSSHTMGIDEIADKTFVDSLEKLLDKSQVEIMRNQDGWSDDACAHSALAKKVYPVADKQIEDERIAAYAESWGAW